MNFLQDLTIDKVRNLAEDAFNQAKPKTELETRVYEVLSHKNWGASTSLLNQIAKDSFDYDKYAVISELMWQSMENQRPAAWRVVFKALSLLEHLIKNGSERCVDDARNHGHALRALQQFNYYEGTVDRGLGVREKSKQLMEILSDDERVREERMKARKLREKFGSKLGGVSGGAGSGGYGGSSGWDNGASSGYGEGGIGSERRTGGGGRYDADPRGPSGGYAGRYDEDRGGRASAAAEPTFASLPDDKRKKTKSKKESEPAPAPAPEIDLFAFDAAPVPAPAATASATADDFSDFQGSAGQGPDPFSAPAPASFQGNGFGDFNSQPNNASQFDAFSQPPTNNSQQQFDAFGGSSGAMSNMMGGNAMSNNNFVGGMGQIGIMQSSTQPSSQAKANDDDDFGDFAAAQPSKSPAAPAKSNDPFGALVSLDGLSLTSNKKKTEDKLNAPVIAYAAAETYIKEKEQIQQSVLQSKKSNMASFDGLVDLPKPSMGGMTMGLGMNMNVASLGMNPNVMSSGSSGDAIGTIFDPSNLQPQQQQMGGMSQGFGGQQPMSGAIGNPMMMGQMNQQQQMMMSQMTPQQQQQMMMMYQQQMMQQQRQSGFGGQGMGNPMGGFQ